ncbi:MAG: helix-turn-helix domain-containing protein [Pseudomonadota bacterium]
MPYTPEHAQRTRARIIEAARRSFNRRGYLAVSIDDVMADAGLTRGGFYNHFSSKESLLLAVLDHASECSPLNGGEENVRDRAARSAQTIDAYLSAAHLEDVAAHCPLVALPADVARGGDELQTRYRQLVEAMVQVHTDGNGGDRPTALATTAMCVGAMLIARTSGDQALASELLTAARNQALDLQATDSPQRRRGASGA